MKVQIIQKGKKTFLKGYFLGFIPIYFDDGYEGGWWFFREDISPERAKELIERWIAQKKERDAFKASASKIILTAYI